MDGNSAYDQQPLPGYESGLLTCPFNPSHQIMPFRMAKHLIKCERQYPDLKLEKCKYNSTHRIHKDEMAKHVETCPDRRALELYMSDFATPNQPMNRFNAESQLQMPKGDEEEWVADCIGTYNPQEAAKKKGVLRPGSFILKTPAERRNLKEEERKRLNELDFSNTSMASGMTSMSSNANDLP